METKTGSRSERLRAAHDKLQAAVAEIVSGDDWQRMLKVISKFHKYSFNNHLMIFMQRPDATIVAGFNKWKSFGRCVREGEKGIAIFAPCKYKTTIEDENGEEQSLHQIRGFRVVHVFDISQTEGQALPDIDAVKPKLLDGDAPSAIWSCLVGHARTLGYEVIRDRRGAENGFCDFTEKVIGIRPDVSPSQALKTLVHEVGHVMLHSQDAPATCDIAEVEVESVAYVVCDALGVPSDAYSFPYVAVWSRGDCELLKKTAERVTNCATQILSLLEKEASDGGPFAQQPSVGGSVARRRKGEGPDPRPSARTPRLIPEAPGMVLPEASGIWLGGGSQGMSEELRQKGYLRKGKVRGDKLGPYESFNLGNSTLNQLREAGIVPDKSLGKKATLKPDGLVIHRTGSGVVAKLVLEFKDKGELDTEAKRAAIFDKTAREYCHLLECSLAAISDGSATYWILVDPATGSWKPIEREDGYLLEARVDLSSDDGRELVARTLARIDEELDPATGILTPIEAVNPTRLAEQTWQTIWLASGEDPDACLASFVEILIFKFLSDLKILTETPTGVKVSFDHLRTLTADKILKYYFEFVRPEIKRLFPTGADGTSVINGIVLDPANEDHGRLFDQILEKFESFGTLRRIDPEFKSRIFERFLKKTISQKNWGQFFTPRNVVKAMIEMSGIEHLTPGSVVADPACGVGGFLLEPLVHKRPHDFRASGSPSLNYRGFDRDAKTIILAKANMLIHLSEVLERDPSGAPAFLGPVLNEAFRSTAHSITGSLSLMPSEEYDLLMTNPPYVVTGTSTQRAVIAGDAAMSSYYELPGSGVENLFLQLIIKGLKPGARAVVIVPDGLLLRHSEETLKRHLLEACQLEAVISLPKDTFYSTPKKTYILCFRKKQVPGGIQDEPVFTYLVGAVGETLDAKRFPIDENDLPTMAEAFKLFQGAPKSYVPPVDSRLKVQPIDRFQPEEHWLIDRWWSEEERRALGDLDEIEAISPEDLAQRLEDVSSTLRDLAEMVKDQKHLEPTEKTVAASLGDSSLFRLSIGKRVLKKDLHGKKPGPIPLYSANVEEPFGHIDKSNLKDFSRPSVLFGIDGDFKLSVKEAGVTFDITDHCGRIEILNQDLDPSFCRAAIALARAYGFDRTLRPSLTRVKAMSFEVPVNDDGSFDVEAQRAIAAKYESIVETLKDVKRTFSENLTDLEPNVMLR